MQDKINFGKYITEKRKEKGLTQEELANKLYVISTTISKWERGVSYPDISVITNLCNELDISEHEFFTACAYEAMTKKRREPRQDRALKKWLFNIINIGYLITIIICFICNLVIDHKLSWSLIVLMGIFISFSMTSLPYYLQSNKYKFCKIFFIVTILIYLLLFTINYVNNGDWLLGSILIASFVLIFLWVIILVCTFTKIALYYKVSISLLILSFIMVFTNHFCAEVLDFSNNENNVPNLICTIITIVIALYLSLKQFFNTKN